MASEFLVRSAALTGFAALCRSLGLDPVRLAAACGIPAAALEDPDLPVRADAVARILERAAARSGAADFGVRLAETRKLSNLGPVGLVVREQPDLGAAVRALISRQRQHNQSAAVSLETIGDLAVLRIAFAGPRPASRQATELTLGVLCANLRALAGGGWRPASVLLRHPKPAAVESHRRLFGSVPQFSAPMDALVFPAADLATPLLASDPAMARLIERRVAPAGSEAARSCRAAVLEIIGVLLPTGGCSADRVAGHLGVDRRTVHRRLAAEGASYGALLEERRRRAAREALEAGESVAGAAALSGFGGSAPFSRWFRAAFGAPPTRWRAARRRARSAELESLERP